VSQAEMSDLFRRAVFIQPGLLILFGTLLFVYRRLRP
jgi:hypothetical protein